MKEKFRLIDVHLLNITMHPHDNEGMDYVKVLVNAAQSVETRQRTTVQFSESGFGLIGPIFTHSLEEKGFVYGQLIRYTRIGGPYGNAAQAREATEEELSAIQIPEGVVSDFGYVHFSFYPASHVVIVQKAYGPGKKKTRMTLKNAQRLFEQIFREFAPEGSETRVSQITERSVIERILNSSLKKISIEISLPNDNIDGLRGAFQRSLDSKNASKMTTTFVARPHETLEVDSEITNQVNVARVDGSITADIVNEHGRTEKVTTLSKPESLVTRVSAIEDGASQWNEASVNLRSEVRSIVNLDDRDGTQTDENNSGPESSL